MELLCAIDLRGGGAVRLLKGDYAQETAYGDPLELAALFVAGGTDWLHLVDLDAARDGGRANRSLVTQIARGFPVPVEQPAVGTILFEGPAFFGTAMAPPVEAPAPWLGEHTEAIATELLGLDEAEVERLIGAGVLEITPLDTRPG